MKKLYRLVLAFAFVLLMAGMASATSEIQSGDNAVIVGARMGPQGMTPVTEVIKVSTGNETSAVIGDVMVWNYADRADGYHVIRASVDASIGTQVFAGVMVTSTSQDSAYSYTNPKANSPTVGYMAIRGLARAKIDGSNSTAGERLILNGGTLAASFGTETAASSKRLSQDIGILLEDTGGDTINRVWLK